MAFDCQAVERSRGHGESMQDGIKSEGWVLTNGASWRHNNEGVDTQKKQINAPTHKHIKQQNKIRQKEIKVRMNEMFLAQGEMTERIQKLLSLSVHWTDLLMGLCFSYHWWKINLQWFSNCSKRNRFCIYKDTLWTGSSLSAIMKSTLLRVVCVCNSEVKACLSVVLMDNTEKIKQEKVSSQIKFQRLAINNI